MSKEMEDFCPQEHFGACENCEPMICCGGGIQDMCGCRGMPYAFKPTDECGAECRLKRIDKEGDL